MGNPTKALWFGFAVLMLALPAHASDDLYASQIVEQARQWQQKNRDDLAADLWRKLLMSDPVHPEALIRLGIIEAHAGRPGQAEALLHRAMQLRPAPGGLQDLSDAIKTTRGTAAEAPPKPSLKEAPASTASARPPPKKVAVLPEPAVGQAPPRSLSSSQPKKSRPAAAAKLSTSVGPSLDANATTKPRATGETELNFSNSLDPGQAKPRP